MQKTRLAENQTPKMGKAQGVERFLSVRKNTESLAAPLIPEDMVVQSMPDVSPTKWHLAHTTWFFETFILQNFDPDYKVFDAAYNYLFNSYYNAVGERHPRPKRGMLTRPPLADVMNYRNHVTEAMANLAECQQTPEIFKLLELGCHHEQQHQELLLTDIKHVLFQNPLKPAYHEFKPANRKKAPALSWQSIAEGVYEIGFSGAGFHFDCEGPRHKTYLNGCQLANRPVTNREFLEFIKDKGYQTPELWLSDGWADITEHGTTGPLYWANLEDGWHEFTFYGGRPLEQEAPVCHLSYYEADAFARWAGARLPTEAELEVMAVENGQTKAGEVWEWSSSAYAPYPGFKPASGAVGEYNGKFMSGQQVLRGGSVATPENHWRPTYRNFFYPPSQWQFTGLRLAK